MENKSSMDNGGGSVKPNFLGIGAPKCGTTWLSEVLRKHPEIFVAHGKELVYFVSEKQFRKGERWYLDHFSKVTTESAIGEFSVSYLGGGAATAERIQEFSPEMKLIAVFRDPVHRAWSHYRWLQQLGKCNLSFVEALKNDRHIVNDSMYFKNLSCYFDRFSRDNILIIRYEDIKNEPMTVQQSVYGFLGVDSSFDSGITKKVIGKTIKPRSRFLENARIKMHTFFRTRGLSVFITLFKRLGLSNLYRQLNNDYSGARKISKKEYDEASTYFREDVDRLMNVTNLDINDWLVWKG